MELSEALTKIQPASAAAYDAAYQHWKSLGKPLYSLGMLEEYICRVAAMRGTARVTLSSPVLNCSDWHTASSTPSASAL